MAELGAGSGTSYPSSLDVDNTVEVDASTTARADVPNDLAAAIIAVQTELGTDPAGSAATVKARLAVEHNNSGTHSSITATNVTISGELIQKVGSDVSSGPLGYYRILVQGKLPCCGSGSLSKLGTLSSLTW